MQSGDVVDGPVLHLPTLIGFWFSSAVLAATRYR